MLEKCLDELIKGNDNFRMVFEEALNIYQKQHHGSSTRGI
jgi:hypothetical protein